MPEQQNQISSIFRSHQETLQKRWLSEQTRSVSSKISEGEVRQQCQSFLGLLTAAIQNGNLQSLDGATWDSVRNSLAEISRSRAVQGFSPSETATFVLSLKRPVFDLILEEHGKNPKAFAELSWEATQLLDQLALYTTEIYQKTRDEIILRQQEDMMELSTPVVKLWKGILALPLIGTLDSSRTQVVMESLLQEIMRTESEIAIIDITGVPTVDTIVAQHLIKTVTAAKLMGAECIISGIRPQIAATIVHLGVDLGDVSTKSSLADAFMLALSKTGRTVTRISNKIPATPRLEGKA